MFMFNNFGDAMDRLVKEDLKNIYIIPVILFVIASILMGLVILYINKWRPK